MPRHFIGSRAISMTPLRSHQTLVEASSMSYRKRKREKRGRLVKPRPPQYSSLTVHEKGEYGRAVDLLYDLRHGETYTNLLRKHRLSAHKAHWYLGSNLIGGTRGKRVRASKSDRLVRELLFPTPFG